MIKLKKKKHLFFNKCLDRTISGRGSAGLTGTGKALSGNLFPNRRNTNQAHGCGQVFAIIQDVVKGFHQIMLL